MAIVFGEYAKETPVIEILEEILEKVMYRKFTSKLPLLVIDGPFLTECL